jgi:hypothetical protein
MPPSRPGGVLRTPPPRQLTPTAQLAAAQYRVKILVAGVDKDARAAVEKTVRQAFTVRDPAESWSVSLVRMGGVWSVTLSGPGEVFKNVSFSVEQHRLGDSLREALLKDRQAPAGPGAAPGAPPPASGAAPLTPSTASGALHAASSAGSVSASGRIVDRHVCIKCQQGVVVSYEGDPNEPKQRAPVACPHCWTVNHVDVGVWAASGGDYFAAKA